MFFLGEPYRGQLVAAVLVVVSPAAGVVPERRVQPLTHEFKIALRLSGRDAELGGQLRRVGKPAGGNHGMKPAVAFVGELLRHGVSRVGCKVPWIQNGKGCLAVKPELPFCQALFHGRQPHIAQCIPFD